MGKIKDKVGHVYKLLTVTSFNGMVTKPSGKKEAVWNCHCECGNSTVVRGGNLKNTDSCGCLRKTNKVTTESLKARLAEVMDVCVDLSKVVYVKSNVKIHLVCSKHGDFYKAPFKALEGQGCPKCASRASSLRPFNEFIRLSRLVQPDHFTFSEDGYAERGDISAVCSVHGDFTQSKTKILLGQIGCRKCRQPIHDVKTFVEKAEEVHGKVYGYSETRSVKNTKSVVTITCNKHGKFTQQVSNHLSGSGCPSCSVTGFSYQKPATLYVLEIESGSNILYKVGITNLSVRERFIAKELKAVIVLYTEEFLVGRAAYVKEQRVLKLLEGYRYSGKHIFRRGNTEILTVNPIEHLKEEFRGKH